MNPHDMKHFAWLFFLLAICSTKPALAQERLFEYDSIHLQHNVQHCYSSGYVDINLYPDSSVAYTYFPKHVYIPPGDDYTMLKIELEWLTLKQKHIQDAELFAYDLAVLNKAALVDETKIGTGPTSPGGPLGYYLKVEVWMKGEPEPAHIREIYLADSDLPAYAPQIQACINNYQDLPFPNSSLP